MPTLDIAGKEVEVGDEFLKLSPDEQNKTVDEIAASMATAAKSGPSPDMGSALNAIQDATTGVGDMMTFGYGDEIKAGMAAPFRAAYNAATGKGDLSLEGLGNAYNQELPTQRAILHQADARSPIATNVGRVAGAVALPTGPANAPVGAMAGMASGAAKGALGAGAYGFGSGEGAVDRVKGGAIGAVTGGALGGAVGGVAGAVAKRLAAGQKPASEVARGLAGEAYGVTDDLPNYDPQTAMNIVPKLRKFAEDQKIPPETFKATHSLIDAMEKDIQKNGTSPALMDIWRKRFGAVQGDRVEGSAAGEIKSHLDDLLQNEIGGPDMAVARQRFRQSIQLEKVENAVSDAVNQATKTSQDLGLHLKNKIGALLKADKAAKLKGRPQQFDKAMQEQMEKIAETGTLEGITRWAGKFAPDSGLGLLLHGIAGVSTGGAHWAAQSALAGGSLVAKRVASGTTNRQVEALKEIIAKDLNPQSTAAARKLLNAMIVGGAVQAERTTKESLSQPR